jgi:hypothetical protein
MASKYDIQQGHNCDTRDWKRQQKIDDLAQKYRAGAVDEGRAPVNYGEAHCVSEKDFNRRKQKGSIADFSCGGGRKHTNHKVRAKASDHQRPVEQSPALRHLKGNYTHTHAKVIGGTNRPTVYANTEPPLDKKPYTTGRRRKPNGGFYQDSRSGAGSPERRVGGARPERKVAWQ